MLSKAQSTQRWLSQFLPEHRNLAELLLDSLHVITTEDMLSDLKLSIQDIACDLSEKSALLPIREVSTQELLYNDKTTPPILQASQESLGSEAFISNLYTELNRSRPRQFLQENFNFDGENKKSPPSISFMKQNKFKHLFLVDDLIGSGDRVTSYLNSLFMNKTINSWVSYGYLKIHIVSFMATDHGKSVIQNAIKRRKNVFLHIMHRVPSIYDMAEHEELIELCKLYSDKKTQYPLGYKNSAVRVAFTHSAPNNLPSLLHRQVYNKFRPDKSLNIKSNQWHALFPNRTIPNPFKQDVARIKEKTSPRNDIIKLLKLVEKEIKRRDDLAHIMNKTSAYTQILIDLCDRHGFIDCGNGNLVITERGRAELASKSRIRQRLEKHSDFYYPRG